METNTALSLVLTFIVLYFWYKFLSSVYLRPYKSNSEVKPLHGIQLIKFSVNIVNDMDNILQTITTCLRKYGPLPNLRFFNTSFVLLTNTADVQSLLSSKSNGHLEKADIMYEVALSAIDGVGLATAPPDKWIATKKLISKAFTYNSLNYYNSHIFNKHAKAMVEKLRNRNDEITGRPIADDFGNCILHIICETVFGLDVNVEPEISEQICALTKLFTHVIKERVQGLFTMLKWLWRFHPSYYRARRGRKDFDGIIRNLIQNFRKQKDQTRVGNNEEEHEVAEGSSRSILELLENSGLTEKEIIIETKTIVGGGYETTSTATQFLVFMLALHQEEQKLCRVEIDAVFNRSSDGLVTLSDISELKHLEKCILETLRLFPVIPLMGRKLKQDFVSESGVTIPSGENVVIYIPSLHKNPELFPNPEVFDPERFSTENVKKRDPYAYLAFSLGRRNCIGYKYAITEIKTIIAHMLWNFEIYTTDKMEDVPTHLFGFLGPARDYNFILKNREH